MFILTARSTETSLQIAGSRMSEAVLLVILTVALYAAVWTIWPTLTAGSGGNDALFLADGARRIALGQLPHRDFSLPTGVEPYLGYLAGGWLLPAAPAYIGAHLVGFLLIAPLVIAAGATFERRIELWIFLLVVALAALFPFNTTQPNFYGISFIASYNRLASAFSIAALAWIFRSSETGGACVKGVLLAYALLFAFFLKIVLVGVALAPALVLALCNPVWRRAVLIGAGLSIGALAGVEAASGGLVSGYIADIRAMSAINSASAPYFFASFIFRTFALQCVLAALIAWRLLDVVGEIRRSGAALTSRGACAALSVPLAMAAAFAALVFSESQGTEGLEFSSAAGLVFAPALGGRRPGGLRMAVLVAAATLSAGALAINAFENGTAVLLKRKGPAAPVVWVERFLPHTAVPAAMLGRAEATAAIWTQGAGLLKDLSGDGRDQINRSDVELYLAQWKIVDDAIRAIGTDAASLGPVVTLANVDLFGLALGAEPAKGVKIVHDVGRTIAPLGFDQARAYLAGARTVFAPTCAMAEAPGPELMSRWFAEALAADFTPRRLNPCWTMHVRK
ncbi:hypothetical protein IHQ68_02705 [Chelatococcus sambhunathii]|uniref:Uncharacterized protein n=1 Tax=Chelatococcus sambhunathii TaxID=363953 RepID=A0ABU1DBY1_9HYPH|nr:hypothetical protein [Chelatococcus sambhunathii]MDR4305533.1 hypothetical protein [Chelatococcus sambhunathii]